MSALRLSNLTNSWLTYAWLAVPTCWLSTFDVALVKPVPGVAVNTAVMAWKPTLRLEVVKLAWLLITGTFEASVALPSLNVTVPVASPAPGGTVIEALNVTGSPAGTGLAVDVSPTVVTAAVTTCTAAVVDVEAL